MTFTYRHRRLGYFTVRSSGVGLLGILLSTGVIFEEDGVTIMVGISLNSVLSSSGELDLVLLSSGELFIVWVDSVDFLAISFSRILDLYNCL